MLHIVNKSPLDRNTLQSCLDAASEGSLLLIEDGVYAATKGNAYASKLIEAMSRLKIYALKADLEARGMADRVLDGVTMVGYDGFVDLVAEYRTCQSWL